MASDQASLMSIWNQENRGGSSFYIGSIPLFFLFKFKDCIYLFKDLIHLFMRDTEREAEIQAEGEAGSMQGA